MRFGKITNTRIWRCTQIRVFVSVIRVRFSLASCPALECCRSTSRAKTTGELGCAASWVCRCGCDECAARQRHRQGDNVARHACLIRLDMAETEESLTFAIAGWITFDVAEELQPEYRAWGAVQCAIDHHCSAHSPDGGDDGEVLLVVRAGVLVEQVVRCDEGVIVQIDAEASIREH